MTNRVTDEQLDQWAKLCEEATKGPWEFTVFAKQLAAAGWPCTVYGVSEDDKPDDGSVMVCDLDDVCGEISKEQSLANAELLAASRTALPALIAEVRAMRACQDAWMDNKAFHHCEGVGRIKPYSRVLCSNCPDLTGDFDALEFIASLEAQCVSLRDALDGMLDWALANRDAKNEFVISRKYASVDDPHLALARAALSTSTEYEGKVVVDREEWNLMCELGPHVCVPPPYGNINCAPNCKRCKLLARLDSLRSKGGGE